MANKRIDQLNPNLEALTGNEFIPIFDTSTNTTERITINTLSSFIDKDIFTTGTTLSGNTILFDRNDIFNAYSVDLTPMLSGFSTTDTYVTGGTYNSLTESIDFSGNSSETTFSVNVSQLLDDTNTFTTGVTLNGNIIEFNRNDLSNAYSVDLSQLVFTGNTSGDCITDLYITNLNSCSPLHIQPTNNGDVYISESGGNVGIGTNNPITTLDVNGDVNISNSLSATTFYGDGSNLRGIDNFYVTGGTYNPLTKDINFSGNSSETTFSVDVSGISVDSKKYGNIIFVDKVYGDDFTADKNDPLKPFFTYSQAVSQAVSGDLIILRPGSYSENVILKDGVDIYGYSKTFISFSLTDNGVSVNCKIFGEMNLRNISLTGTDSNVEISCSDINSGSVTSFNSTSGGKIKLNCKTITTTNTNVAININTSNTGNTYNIICDNIYSWGACVRLVNEVNLNLNVTGDIVLNRPTFAGEYTFVIDIQPIYNGITNINCRNIISESNRAVISVGNDGTAVYNVTGELYVNCEKIESTFQTNTVPFVNSVIQDFGGTNIYINCKLIKAIGSTNCYHSSNFYSSKKTVITGAEIISENNITIRPRGSRTLILNNCKITRSGDIDDNRLLVMGQPTGYGGYFGGVTDFLRLEVNNSLFIKNGSILSEEPFIIIDGPNSKVNIKNCEIISDNTSSNIEAFYADSIAEGNIYFKNTVSNIDNNENITDISAVSGFILDPNINTLQ
jgi:hypothetical protein